MENGIEQTPQVPQKTRFTQTEIIDQFLKVECDKSVVIKTIHHIEIPNIKYSIEKPSNGSAYVIGIKHFGGYEVCRFVDGDKFNFKYAHVNGRGDAITVNEMVKMLCDAMTEKTLFELKLIISGNGEFLKYTIALVEYFQ